MNKKLITGALGLVLTGATTIAFAEPQNKPGSERPERGDRPPLSQIIQDADTDGDGKATLAEIQAVAPRFPEHAFSRIDRDGDGVLTVDEIPDRRKEGFGPPRRGDRPEGSEHRRSARETDGREDRREKMRAADVNEDRQISREEFAAAFPDAPADRFDQMDRNGDGVLTREDRPEGPPPRDGDYGRNDRRDERGPREYMARLREADTDADHQITPTEFAAAFPEAPADRFNHMDRNEDGVLSPADRPEGPPRHFRGGPHGDEDGGHRGHMIDDADTNNDGQVSYEELSAAKPGFPEETFHRLDTNNDGVLTADERPEGRGPRGDGRGPRGGKRGPHGGEGGPRFGPPSDAQ